MKLNLHALIRRYWSVQFAKDTADYLGPVGIRVDKNYLAYAHKLLLLEEDRDGGVAFSIRHHIMAYTYNENPVIELKPIGEGLYRSTNLINIPYEAGALFAYLEQKGLITVVPYERLAVPYPPEDAAVVFTQYKEDMVSTALACGHAYLANALYPKEYTELLPNPRPVVFCVYYRYRKGNALTFYDKQNNERLGLHQYFPGSRWTEAKSLSELLYYVNRGLGLELPQRKLDRYFTALAVKAYADVTG